MMCFALTTISVRIISKSFKENYPFLNAPTTKEFYPITIFLKEKLTKLSQLLDLQPRVKLKCFEAYLQI